MRYIPEMRARLRRSIAAFVSLWFLIVMIEPQAVHSCPVHTPAPAASGDHSQHHTAGTGDPDSSNATHGTCSCPGDCAASSVGSLPTTPARVEALVVFRIESAPGTAASVRLERFDLLLPFAIGPPTFAA